MTARGKKGATLKFNTADQKDAAGFGLPDSLPCSEVDFPVLIRRRTTANWKDIIDESEKWKKQLEEYQKSKHVPPPKPPFLKTEADYIINEVFVQLLPALAAALNKAVIWDAFNRDKCFFNGIDHIVQVLWNNNPRFPSRKETNLHIFNIPWVRQTLKKKWHYKIPPCITPVIPKRSPLGITWNLNKTGEIPRPYYPKSWLWPEEYAATLIQKSVRQYFIQKQEEVQEMRDFWRKLEVERQNPELIFNPMLAKAFASGTH